MAKVIKVTVTYGGTVNIGNYSNVQPSITHEVELEEGDDPAVVTEEATLNVRNLLFDQVESLNTVQKNYWLKAVAHSGAAQDMTDDLAF